MAQTIQGNKDAFKSLGKDACDFVYVVIISTQRERDSKEEISNKKLFDDLQEIARFVAGMNDPISPIQS